MTWWRQSLSFSPEPKLTLKFFCLKLLLSATTLKKKTVSVPASFLGYQGLDCDRRRSRGIACHSASSAASTASFSYIPPPHHSASYAAFKSIVITDDPGHSTCSSGPSLKPMERVRVVSSPLRTNKRLGVLSGFYRLPKL